MQLKNVAMAAIGSLFIFATGLTVGICMDSADAAPATDARVYELRTYFTNDGKLDDLHSRFSTHTNHLFVKHGIQLHGYWTLEEGEGKDSTLVYLISHEDKEAAGKNWRAFGGDPDWRAAYADSRKDGALVKNITSQYMIPTDYSPLR